MWQEDGPDHMSPVFRGWLGGLVATGRELAWMFAPTVNSYKRYQPESWAPTALAWGRDNRTCGFRLVGHGQGFRIESRIPGADCNPYLAFAATIAAGLARHREQASSRRRCSRATRTTRPTSPTCRGTSSTRSTSSSAARSRAAAFGEDVHQHLVNTARQEWAVFNQAVTDWELRRNFEQF